MKQGKQGFTLIELLAVIVILAIIALIATPIVLNIIANTKENAQLRSAEMYLDAVEQSVALERMTNTTFNPNKCTITNEGNLYCEGYQNKIDVKVNGEKPNNGSISFIEGKIKDIELKYENGKTIVKDKDENLVYGEKVKDEEEIPTVPGAYYIDGTYKKWEDLGLSQTIYQGDFDSSVEKIVIPDGSVITINAMAFMGLNNLTTVVFPKSITYLSTPIFSGCSSLKVVVVPSTETIIQEGSGIFVGVDGVTLYYSGDTTGFPWNGTNIIVKPYEEFQS